jgi:uncharacterized protein with NRDE domain
MCTLIAVVAASPSAPLLIAANRDERTTRPARPPFLWPAQGGPRFVAPRDEQAGGSWLGLSERGLFVGITNRAGVPLDPSRRSRGALVIDALRAPSAGALHARLAGLDPRSFNPFHLFYADRRAACLTYHDGQAIHQERLPPGLHIITERSLGAAGEARAERIRERWGEIAKANTPSPPFDALSRLLAEHAEDPIAGTCVHLDALAYGTRSSMILLLGPTWPSTRLLWAEGRPCVTPFVDQRALLEDLVSAG